MVAADLMQHAVVAIGADAPLVQAIRLMTQHRVSGLPVVAPDGKLVGILTEGDLLRRVEMGTQGEVSGWFASFFRQGHEAGRYALTHARRVAEVMTPNVLTVAPQTPLAEVVELMQRHRVKRLPVLEDGRLVGIVSRADFVRRLGAALDTPAGPSDADTIRHAIEASMAREPWARGGKVSIGIADGVVQLDGCVFDVQQLQGLSVLVENVPGVVRVENRLICIEPTTGIVVYDPAAPAKPEPA